VHLIGHLNRLLLKDQDVDDLAKRGYTREQLDAMYSAMKQQDRKIPEVKSLNVSFRTDLSDFNFPQFNFVYAMYSKYDKYGVLPFGGTHSEQPAKMIEIFDVIGAIHAEEEERLRK